jgi:hypothetical protein
MFPSLKIFISFALFFSLAAFVSAAQAETMDIPLPTEDPAIQNVVGSVKTGVDVKTFMVEIRDRVKAQQVKGAPLMRLVGDGISEAVSARVREVTRTQTRKAQMAAMMDPENPDGVPDMIAPKFEFE